MEQRIGSRDNTRSFVSNRKRGRPPLVAGVARVRTGRYRRVRGRFVLLSPRRLATPATGGCETTESPKTTDSIIIAQGEVG